MRHGLVSIMNRFYNICFVVVLMSIFLSPRFEIGRYEVYVFDFLLPVIAPLVGIKCFLWFKGGHSLERDFRFLFLFFSVFGLYFLVFIISNIHNGILLRINVLSESYKYIRYLVYSLFFLFFFIDNKNEEKFKYYVHLIFAFIFVFNVFNYFNILNFNTIIEPHYSWGAHLEFFGLNSSGEKDTKRLIGTFGNPNLNAFAMTFFFLYYFIHFIEKNSAYYLLTSSLSLLLMLLCQSRTVLLGSIIIVVFVIFTGSKKFYYKFFQILKIILVAAFFLIIFIEIDKEYNTMHYLKNTELKNRSVVGRLEIFKDIINLIIQKPLLGYGTNKDFFIENNIHPESEYMLILFYYGIMGLMVFLFYYFFPIIVYLRKRFTMDAVNQMCLSYFILSYICSVTNVVFWDFQLNMLYALVLSVFLSHNYNLYARTCSIQQ